MFLRKFKWFRKLHNFYQRGKKGYCNEDLWDLYNWFTGLFPKMLDDFLKQSQGYPCPMLPSNIKERENGRDQEAWYEEQRKNWEYEVRKLSWYLNEANDETCSQKNEIVYDVKFEFTDAPENSFLHELKIVYPTKEDERKSHEYSNREKEITAYKEESFNKALEQFKKIARHLWD